jgi:hypothetical protein
MKNPPTRDDREKAEYLQRRWHRNDTTSITLAPAVKVYCSQVLVYLITPGARLSQFLAQILPSHFPAAVASRLRGKSALLGKLDSM